MSQKIEERERLAKNGPHRPRVIFDSTSNKKSSSSNQRNNDSLYNNQTDEGISSSISNTSNTPDYNQSTTSFLNMKNKDLKQSGAYIISQKIKNDCSLIKVIDLADNRLQDEGIMHLAFSFKACNNLTNLTLNNNSITEYGLRILLENLNITSLIFLDISDNSIGSRGAEFMANFLNTSKLKQLMMNNTNLGEVGSRSMGIAIGANSTLKSLEFQSNSIKLTGAAAFARGLMVNTTIEEVNLSNNNFGLEGAIALSECIKANKSIRILNLHTNNFAYDSMKHIANGLKQNSTLKNLNLSYNNIGQGIYDLLSSINNDTSSVEYLCVKNIPLPKHLVLIIELIQQRRKFQCEYSAVMFHADSVNNKRQIEEESMIKLARYLSEKRMRLVDMFKVLDKGVTHQMNKEDFGRRMKIFEPRLTTRDIANIAKSFTDKDIIDYSSLIDQASIKLENKLQITRMKAQLDESEEQHMKNNKVVKPQLSLSSHKNKDKNSASRENMTAKSLEESYPPLLAANVQPNLDKYRYNHKFGQEEYDEVNEPVSFKDMSRYAGSRVVKKASSNGNVGSQTHRVYSEESSKSKNQSVDKWLVALESPRKNSQPKKLTAGTVKGRVNRRKNSKREQRQRKLFEPNEYASDDEVYARY